MVCLSECTPLPAHPYGGEAGVRRYKFNNLQILPNMRHLLLLFLWLTPFVGTGLMAQNAVQVTTTALPPFDPFLQDYFNQPGKLQVIVRNTTGNTVTVKLLATLTGDNGVEIATSPGYQPLLPLTLGAFQTRLLNVVDLKNLIDLTQVTVQGFDKAALLRGQALPEGDYQLCLQAVDIQTNQPLSLAGLGCTRIPVKSVEPPILIAPLCDQEVTPVVPQNIVFTWSPPAGVRPTNVEYTLRVVELPLQDVDPNVFIDAVVLPASGVEVKNLRVNSFLYSPIQPALKFGKKYAWRVQARDPQGKLVFLNDGKSPVCSFQYGDPPVNKSLTIDKTLTMLTPKTCGDTVSAGIGRDLLLVWRLSDAMQDKLVEVASKKLSPVQILGLKAGKALILNQFPNAYYNFSITGDKGVVFQRNLKEPFFQYTYPAPAAGKDNPIAGNGSSDYASLNLTPGKAYTYSVELVLPSDIRQQADLGTDPIQRDCSFKLVRKDAALNDAMVVSGKVNYQFSADNGRFPLPSTRVRLFYVDKGGEGRPEQTEIATSTTTNALGEYIFLVKNYKATVGKIYAGDAADTLRGFLVTVESPYFEPNRERFRLPLGVPTTVTLPDVTLLARTYNLTVSAVKTYTKKGFPNTTDPDLDGQLVMVYRKPGPGAFPPIEGMADNTNKAAQTIQPLVNKGPIGSPKNGQVTVPTNVPNQVGTIGNQQNTGGLTGTVGTPSGNIDGTFGAMLQSEGDAKADLNKQGLVYVASGRLKKEGNLFVVRFERLYSWNTSDSQYYLYGPNMPQTPDDAQPFAFVQKNTPKAPNLINPSKPAWQTMEWDIVAKDAPTVAFKGRMLYEFPDPNDPAHGVVKVPKAMPNATVSLVLTYVLKGASGSAAYPAYSDHLKVLATTRTDGNGNFSFSAALDKPYKLGLIEPNYSKQTGSGEFVGTISGQLYRTFRVMVQNPYFASPADDFGDLPTETLIPFGDYDLGDLKAVAQSFNLTVKTLSNNVTCQANGANNALQGINVYILRKPTIIPAGTNLADALPPNDDGTGPAGTLTDANNNAYRIVSQALTDANGQVNFPKLMRSDPFWNGSRYMIATSSNAAVSQANTQTTQETLQNGGTNMKEINLENIDLQGPNLFANEYAFGAQTYTYSLTPKAPRLRIRAIDGANGLAGATVKVDFTVNGGTGHYESSTDPDGYFVLNFGDLLGDQICTVKNIKYTVSLKGYNFRTNDGVLMPFATVTKPEGLKLGENYNNELTFVPNATVKGRIIRQSDKQPEQAYVQVNDGEVVKTDDGGFYSVRTAFNPKQPTVQTVTVTPLNVVYFEETRTLQTNNFEVNKGISYNYPMPDIALSTREHRIRFRVIPDAPGGNGVDIAVSGAVAEIFGQKFTADAQGYVQASFANVSVANLYATVSALGYVTQTVAFEKNDESRTFTDLPPVRMKKARFINGTVVSVEKDPATLKNKETQLTGANVFTINGWSGSTYQTLSKANGLYSLEIPADISGTIYLLASYKDNSGKTYDGDKVQVTLPPNVQSVNQKLTIGVFSKFKINDLWGFPVNVTDIKDENGIVKVSGELQLSVGAQNAIFGSFRILDPSVKVRFNNVTFALDVEGSKAGFGQVGIATDPVVAFPLTYLDVAYAEVPAGGNSTFNADYFNVKLHGIDGENKPLAIRRPVGTKYGVIRAQATIVDNSFKFPSTLLSYPQGQFSLFDPGENGGQPTGQPSIKAFDAQGAYGGINNIKRGDFGLSQKDGKPLQFSLIEFDATSAPVNSRLDKGGIYIAPKLNVAIPNAQPAQFTVEVGKLVILNNTLPAQTGTSSLSFALGGQWNVSVQGWTLDYQKGGFYYKAPADVATSTALIRTGTIDLPIPEFNLRHDLLKCDPKVNGSISLAGIADMQVPGDVKFGYDTHCGSDQAGHWTVVFVPGNSGPAARLLAKNLPGLTDNIDFGLFRLIDNGEQVLAFGGGASQDLSLNNIAKLRPSSIATGGSAADGTGYFALIGAFNVNIPRVPKDMFSRIVFSRGKGGAIQRNLTFPDPFSFEAPGYVQFTNTLAGANKNSRMADQPNQYEIYLQDNLLVMRGTVGEPGEMKQPLNALLIHTPTFTRITNERNLKALNSLSDLANLANLNDSTWQYVPQKVLAISATKYFDKALCDMTVAGSDWGLLNFSGLPTGYDGLVPNRMPFVVHGEIVANTKKVGVTKMNFAGATVSVVYDVDKSRLDGTIIIPKTGLDGGMSFNGTAQFRIDENGFYMAASGVVTDVPIIIPVTLKAGVLIAWYSGDVGDARTALFTYTHRKRFPCSVKTTDGFKGFFVIGEIPIPKLDGLKGSIDLGIASAGFRVSAYVDAYLSAQLIDGTFKLAGGVNADAQAVAFATIPFLVVNGYAHVVGALDFAATVGGGYDFYFGYGFKLSEKLIITATLALPYLPEQSVSIAPGFCMTINGGVGVGPKHMDGPDLGLTLSECQPGCQTKL